MSTSTARILLATSLLVVSAAAPRSAYAQPDPASPAAHALVLSGGGARGLAHAGSIVALDQLGYDPSLVVGTSMGAIVGALYAAGYSPAEVRDFVAAENWLERFSAAPIPFGRTRVPLRPVLGVGISHARSYEGLVPAAGVNMRLVQLLFDAGARARNDFDSLPRRFRAVAADLGTGEEVVLGAGDLPRAVRASMAVPGVFAPILWDGRVLADGGLANNLPISVAAALTDAPILAVDVLRPAEVVEERSSLDLGIRALRLLIANAQPDSMEPDIIVLPRIGEGFGEARFPADASDLLTAGYSAALEQAPAAVPAQTGARREPGAPPRTITALRVNADDAATARLVRRIMMPAVGPYDAAGIIRRAAALYGTGLFQAVWPWLDFDDGDVGAATLVIDVTPVARTRTAAALRWDDDTGGAGWATLAQRFAITTPVELRAGLLLTELGHAASVELSAFSSLLPGVIWNGGVHAGDHRVRLFSGDTVYERDLHRRVGGWAGAEIHGPVSDWFLSAVARAEHLRRESGDDGWGYGPFLRLAPPPRVDRVVGLEPLIEWETRVGAVAYSRGQVRLSGERRFGAWRTALLGDLHGTTRGAPADARPAAVRDLAPWLAAGRLRGRATATAGLDAAHPFVLDGFVRLRLRTFGMVTGPHARATDLRATEAWHVGGELAAIWPTVIGPVTAGIAAGRSDWRVNISIGSQF